jgi:hypothetical protein
MNIHFNNYSKHVGKRGGKDYFIWRVFVDENSDVLDQIKSVQYLLHPSFPNPFRISEDKKSKFALESSGWGNFNMQITVTFNDETKYETSYYLDLKKPWPAEVTQLKRVEGVSENLVFVNGIPGLYEALKKSGRDEEAEYLVKNFLISSFNEDLDRKVERLLNLPSGIFPADRRYFEVFWELNQLYVNGLYHSTVVMAGVLCEQMCYDILEKNSVKVPEGICLSDLITLLSKTNIAKAETIAEMKEIMEKRNEYMHLKVKKTYDSKDAAIIVERIGNILKNEFAIKHVN